MSTMKSKPKRRKVIFSLESPDAKEVVLMGDFNEWFPFRRQLLLLNRLLGKISTRPTYPSRYPILALDRIWVRPKQALQAIKIHKSPLARIASDHLPLKARIAIVPPA